RGCWGIKHNLNEQLGSATPETCHWAKIGLQPAVNKGEQVNCVSESSSWWVSQNKLESFFSAYVLGLLRSGSRAYATEVQSSATYDMSWRTVFIG
ncbi:unnamed protein product, partial [Amoebophrya sp. A120]